MNRYTVNEREPNPTIMRFPRGHKTGAHPRRVTCPVCFASTTPGTGLKKHLREECKGPK